MPTTLVAGASGYLGRYIVAELHRRGHTVHAVVRNQARAEAAGPWSTPALKGLVKRWLVGDVTDPDFTGEPAVNVDNVISALGVTRQKADPWEIDYGANVAILDSALAHKVSSFSYINVLGGDRCPAKLTRAKTAFAQKLAASEVTSQIINPTGYFSDMMEVFALAKRGVVPLLRPQVRINPIHGADLAEYVVKLMEDGSRGVRDVGGPETFTWEELAKIAFAVSKKSPRFLRVPSWVIPPVLLVLSLVSPRLADAARFTTWNMMHDCVAPPTGSRHLADFYLERAGNDSNTR